MHFVTLRRLAALALILVAPAAMAQQSVQHTTGTVTFRVFDNGYFGAALGVPATGTFLFGGQNGLWEGQLMVGLSANQVAGHPYRPVNTHEWTGGADPAAILPPTNFNQAFQAGPYTDGAPGNPNPIGLSVLQRSYSSNVAPNNDFAIVELEITNTSPAPLNDVFVGMFADLDAAAPDYTTDLAGYDPTTKLLYVFNSGVGNPHHFGVAVIGSTVSGYTDDVGAGVNPNQAQVFAGLTSTVAMSTIPADRRTVIGTGPYSIGVGATVMARFAYLGGSSAVDIIANAAAAQALFPTTANEGGPNANGYAISTPRPNPITSTSDLTVTLPTAQNVRVAVYDVTGREVAVLVDEARAAGTHTMTWDATSLPSGVYMVRLTPGGETLSQTVSVSR